MTPKIEDVAYLSPEELRRRGLAPPPEESRLDDDVPEPDQEPHGDTSSEEDTRLESEILSVSIALGTWLERLDEAKRNVAIAKDRLNFLKRQLGIEP